MRDRRTWAVYLLLGLFAYLETAIGPAMPFLRAQLGLGYALASLHFSAFALGAAAMGLTGERWLRRIGRRAALWGGLAGMVAGALLIAFSPSAIGTIGGALVMGYLGTLSLMANQAILADLYGALRTIALTESNVAATVAATAAPLAIGGSAAAGWGWQMGLALPVLALALLWAVFRGARFPPVAESGHTRAGDSRLPAAFWLLAVVLFLVSAVEWCMAYWGADFLASVIGLERPLAATAMTLFFAAMAGGRFAGSRLARHYAAVTLLLVAIAIGLGGFLLFWLGPGAAVSLTGLFVAGLGIANVYPLTVSAALGAAPHLVDRATARLAVAASLALLLVPFAVGAVADAAGMRLGFGIVAPLLVAAFAGVLVAGRWLTRGARSMLGEGVADSYG
ncbi:MAG: MFS transporter [Thermomicrobiales bacterium]|nr:MFS transporter [Thermomicrobiales bacterium]